MTNISKRIWAKISPDQSHSGSFAWLSVYQHAIDSMFVAEMLYKEFLSPKQREKLVGTFFGDEELSRKVVMFLCGIHDIGKITPLFALGSRVSGDQRSFLLDIMMDTGLVDDDLSSASYERQEIRHCFSGAYFLQEWLEQDRGIKKRIAKTLSTNVNGHHGEWKMVGCASRDILAGKLISGGKPWQEARAQLCESISSACGLSDDDWNVLSRVDVSTSNQMLLTGITIMADWIASNVEFFPLLSSGNIVGGYDGDVERERVEHGMRELSLPSSFDFSDQLASDDLLRERFGIHDAKLNDMQSLVFAISRELSDQNEPALIIIQEEMGKGKTEAALISAEIMSRERANGVLFALPTQATTNAMLPRFTGWVSSLGHDLGFAMQHSAAKANREYDAMRCRSQIDSNDGELPHINTWFEGSRKGILAPFALCTIDQVLMMALNCKFVALKHLGIGTKTIIIDEVHSSDGYMQCFLVRALEWLAACGVTVIMLSATLSKRECAEMLAAYHRGANPVDDDDEDWETESVSGDESETSSEIIERLGYPSISVATKAGLAIYPIERSDAPKTYKVRMCPGWNEEKIVEELYRKIGEGGIAGVVCNTVNAAQALYEAAKSKRTDEDVKIILLHSRYTAADRQKIESSLREKLGKDQIVGEGRPYKAIIIGTQVIEQSLDIDLDYMISYLAPIDLILQRIGREHRHPVHDALRPASLSEPEIAIVGYDVIDGQVKLDEGSKYVYESALLLRTLSVLSDIGGKQMRIPQDIEHMMEAVYDQDISVNAVGDAKKWEMELDRALTEYELDERDKQRKANRFILGKPDDADDMILLTCNDETQRDDETAAGVRLGISAAQAICLRDEGDGKARFTSSSDEHEPSWADDFGIYDIIDNIAPLPPGISGAYGNADEESGIGYDVLLDEISREHIERYGLLSIAESSYAHGKKVLVFPKDGALRIGKYLVRYDSDEGIVVSKD